MKATGKPHSFFKLTKQIPNVSFNAFPNCWNTHTHICINHSLSMFLPPPTIPQKRKNNNFGGLLLLLLQQGLGLSKHILNRKLDHDPTHVKESYDTSARPQTMFLGTCEVAAGRSLGGVFKAGAALGYPGGPRGLGSNDCNRT